jgi:hypothetical protein
MATTDSTVNIHEHGGLTPGHWGMLLPTLKRDGSSMAKQLEHYGTKVIDGLFPSGNFHHRDYLERRHWRLLSDIIDPIIVQHVDKNVLFYRWTEMEHSVDSTLADCKLYGALESQLPPGLDEYYELSSLSDGLIWDYRWAGPTKGWTATRMHSDYWGREFIGADYYHSNADEWRVSWGPSYPVEERLDAETIRRKLGLDEYEFDGDISYASPSQLTEAISKVVELNHDKVIGMLSINGKAFESLELDVSMLGLYGLCRENIVDAMEYLQVRCYYHFGFRPYITWYKDEQGISQLRLGNYYDHPSAHQSVKGEPPIHLPSNALVAKPID